METTPKTGLRVGKTLTMSVTSLLLYMLLLSCSGPSDKDKEEPSVPGLAEQVGTPIMLTQTPMATSTLTGPELDATKLAPVEWHRQTVVAFATQYAIETPVPPPPLPNPTLGPLPPPELGIHGCGGVNRRFDLGSCWAGEIPDGYIFANTRKSRDEPFEVTLMVSTTPPDRRSSSLVGTYAIPSQGDLPAIASVDWPLMTLITSRESPTITTFVFNLLTRQWEQPPAQCALYPIALHINVVSESVIDPRYIVRESYYGTGNTNFGWLSWNGVMLTDTLALSLTFPGDSALYVNPNDPTDHTLSMGDWVVGRPEVSSSQVVSDALGLLVSSNYRVIVPVWDQVTGQGNNLRYRVSGFAWVYGIEEYSIAQPNRIALHYWGPATCPNTP